LAHDYVRGIKNELEYWGTWAPSTHLALGDCGPVVNGIFQRETNIRDEWGIEFEELPNPVTGGWSFNSDKSASITFQLAGGNKNIPQVPAGKAGLSIAFKAEEAIVMAARGGNEGTIANLRKLKKDLIDHGARKGEDAFPRDFCVITTLVTADATTVLVSHAKGGQYVVSAEADLKAGLVDLANVSLGISAAHARNVRTELDAQGGTTPLFKALRLKRRWWKWLEAVPLSLGEVPDDEMPFDGDPFGDD
jgi:hypothetical protein